MALSLFVTIRNLRCYSRIQIIHSSHDIMLHHHHRMTTTTTTTIVATQLQTYQTELISIIHSYNHHHHHSSNHHPKKKKKKQQQQQQRQHNNTILCDITLRNVQSLVQHIHEMCHPTTNNTTKNHHPNKNQNNNNNNNHEISFVLQLIRCIMKCDEIYSRLYYNDLTTTMNCHTPNGLPPGTARSDPDSDHFFHTIPNPWTYYNEWNSRTIINDSNHTDTTDTLSSVMASTENPLYRIYQYRMAETWSLFQAMVSRIDATTHVSIRQCQYDWDLSCRDDLCHLYCYATISNTTLQSMIQYLIEQWNCHHIIEMGAGTGYLAHWLHRLGRQYCNSSRRKNDPHGTFHVSAYDIACSSSSAMTESTPNEYHADMAGYYYPIHHGDGSHRKNSKIIYDRHYNENQKKNNNNSYNNVALLLCYPPPDNEMGYDAIRNYHRYRPSNHNPTNPSTTTTKIVIHIGEFNQGLTGTRAMEEYLLQHFQCVQRYPCHWYGSVDASDISIWIDDRSAKVNPSTLIPSSILLPCTHCRTREGIRRCKYLRSFVFCSHACFQQHIQPAATVVSQQRPDTLQQQLWKIIQIEQLDFENTEHFERLHTR